jgi:hypothetical protein
MSGTVLYTVNDVINIDNTTKNLVFGTNPLQIFKNLNDENVDEVFRVVNGGWFDRVRVNNIYAHTAEQDSSYITGLQVGKINIGETGNEINVNGANVSITTIEDNSTTTINGKTVKIAENQSSTKLLGLDTQIGTKNVDLDPTSNNSLTEIFGKTVKINEYDKIGTQTTINGKTIAICDSNKTGTQTTINGKALNLAENSSTVVMKGIDTTIATVNQSSVTTINGSNLNLAEDNSIVVMKGLTTTISTTAQAGSATTINGKSLNLAEDDSTVTVKGLTTTIATTAQAGSATTINGKSLNLAEDDSTVIVKGLTTTIATTAQAGSATTINGKSLNLAEDDSTVIMKGTNTTMATSNLDSETIVNGKKITIGEDRVNTDMYLHSEDLFIGTSLRTQNIISEADNYQINDNTKGGFLNLNNTTFTIDLGSTATEMLNIKSNKINIDSENGVTGENEINVQTDILKLNKNSTKTYVEVNEIDSKVVIGGEELNETIVNGSNVYIGKGGGFVTIYGNLIQYSEGSNVNIVTNTTTEETSAFHVHNTGTKTALTVIQDNKVSGGGYNLVEFFTQENQDRIPFRVDDIGRVGLGVSESSNLQAWLHVNRNDPDIIGPDYDDLVLVEDTDNDSTPFIIKKEGDIGIGTKTPKYKLDVWTNGSELNGQGDTIRSKGIALRDVVYVKQHETNRILFGLGNKLYLHDGATKLDEIFKSGFTFEHDLTDTENPFNTDITDGTFVFRMSCKIHIAGNDGNVAFRRFEAFVNPQNGTFSNKQMPAHILLTDNVDSVYEHFEFNPIVGGTEYKTTVENVNGTSWKLIIPWKLRSVDPITGSAFTSYPSKSRVYLDVEFFGSEDIGDIKAIPLHLKDDAVF